MSDEARQSQDPDERAQELREHHEEAQKREPDERAPSERSGSKDPTEEGLLSGVPASGANRPTG
jgi:hypothetical protein